MKFTIVLVTLTLLVGAASNASNCGIKGAGKPLSSRIIGGVETAPHEFPWQVLLHGGNHGCGASIIDKQWLVTAAHCMFISDENDHLLGRIPEAEYSVFFATQHINLTNPKIIDNTTFTIPVQKSFVHPKYDPDGIRNFHFGYDIGLLKLSSELPLDNPAFHVGAICLPEADANMDTLAGAECTVTGWGRTVEDPPAYKISLQKANLTIVKQSECAFKYDTIIWRWDNKTHTGAITDEMICASSTGKSSCNGDSGGPLVNFNQKTGRWQLSGIVSWADKCANPDHPDVYTRVTAFLPWIKEITGI